MPTKTEINDKPRLQRGSIWEYKGIRYRVNTTKDSVLIQFEEQWTGVVVYELESKDHGFEGVFVRSQIEFLRKFTLC